MVHDYGEAKALDKQHNFYMDTKDFFAEFMFKPDIQELADFAHLDKNLATTRLASKYQEPERARALLEALHILNNPLYYVEEEVEYIKRYDKFEQYQQVCDCGEKVVGDEPVVNCPSCGVKLPPAIIVVFEQPIFANKIVNHSIYPKMYHKLKSAFYSLTTTAAAREGHLMRAATSTRLVREDSIEERTDSKKQSNYVRNPNSRDGRKF